jgi:hypothetical protein
LRRSLIALTIALTVLPIATAIADVFSACWVTRTVDRYGLLQTVTRCRIAGGDVVDYASDSAVPSILFPQTGTDLTGQCWYYTSAATDYVILVQYANGDADIGLDTGIGIVAIGPTFPRCTSEPTPTPDPSAQAWQYVMQYIHDPPAPDLSPRPGDGVTGIDTYIGVPIPVEHRAQLSNGAVALDVFIEVSAVIVDWGDGQQDSYPATGTLLAGYPDGYATHVYEVKSAEGVSIEVSYDWTARWRLAGESWEFLPVPNTTTTVAYPIAEIVSDLTG